MSQEFKFGDPVHYIGQDGGGMFVGTDPYGHAVIEETVKTYHNGKLIGTDVYRVTRYMSSIEHAE